MCRLGNLPFLNLFPEQKEGSPVRFSDPAKPAILPSAQFQPKLALKYSIMLAWGAGLVEDRVEQSCSLDPGLNWCRSIVKFAERLRCRQGLRC